MPADASAAFRAIVSGRVQGVGFRYSAVREARGLGILGTISNLPDGGVAVSAEGDPQRLQRFLDWLRKGPPGAHVSGVEVSWAPPTRLYSRFDIEY
jgi:acylphosphatase